MFSEWIDILKSHEIPISESEYRRLKESFESDLAKGLEPGWDQVSDALAALWPEKSLIEASAELIEAKGKGVAAYFSKSPIAEGVKNALTSRLLEIVNFAAVQKKRLADTNSFNRHIVKSASEMASTLASLEALGSSAEELSFLYNKYNEFCLSINTEAIWKEHNEYTSSGAFYEYMDSQRGEFLSMLKKGMMHPEAVRPFIEGGDSAFQDALESLYEDCLEASPQLAAQIRLSGLIGFK